MASEEQTEQPLTPRQRALQEAKDIRDICQDVYNKGLKGEDVIGPLSDIYKKSYEIDTYINSLPDTAPAQPAPTTGA